MIPTRRFVPLLAAALAAGAARAEPLALAFEQAIYQDAKEAPLRTPEGVACSETALWVADTGNHRLVSFGLKDGRLTLGTEVKLAQLTYPTRLQLDAQGNLLALDGKTHKIVRVDAKGIFTGTVEPKGIANASSVLPVAFKTAGDLLYLLDAPSRRVLVLDASGAVTRQLELPRSGQFVDLTVDLAGTLYAVDAVNAQIFAAAKDAKELTPLTKSLKDRMSFPTYMMTSRGKIFLVDQHGNGLVVLGIDGSYQGRQLSIGWGDGFVYYPSQICMTDEGQVLVADRDNNRVQYFNVVK